MKDSVRLNMLMPTSFLWALTKLSEKRGTSVSQLVRDAIYQFLKAAGALCILLVVGCGGGGSGETFSYGDKITEWKTREAKCQDIKTECQFSGNLLADIFSVLDQLPNFTYIDENGDHWNTSCETLSEPSGECDDIAPMIFRALSDSCIQHNYAIEIYIRIVDQPGIKHMVCVVKHAGVDYEVEDGFITQSKSKVLYEYGI